MAFSKRGGFGGNRNSARPSFNNFNRRDNSDRPELHDAICSECGKDCKVPFRPNGSRPVLCSDCFERNGGGNSDRAPRRFDRDNSRGSSRNFTARPSSNSDDLQAISRKLDKIIELLTVKNEIKKIAVIKKPKVAKVVEVAKEEPTEVSE